MSKLYDSTAAAVADIGSGSRLAVGGFGVCGIPEALINALAETGATDLEVVSNNCGIDALGLGVLLNAGRISRIVASYVGENKEFARRYLSGELEVELTPQGTLAEKLRAGGAGIAAFFTPTGVGTAVAEGGLPWRYADDGSIAVSSPAKEVRTFDGREYVLEEAIRADYALVHALVADTEGNLVFNKAAMNFNPLAAMAGDVCIVQAEQVVPAGTIDPAHVHLPGIFVDRIVEIGVPVKTIEKRTVAAAEVSA
ncbi:CoA transferase subunit A [Gordonia phthalatica]|uniref:Succinyl-CoA:3-ketoacid-CoA transferase n=1 Tax=Gordonia phthalatica TaxID=1136941 RepID=A0A0N9ND46_9ACTN|nr:CoA transferase subunit A [Gordonia phthalatica]ALG84992.1 succinyl-CoA:3-ketoacid-CoA transferase [Gordonia phthalatica]